MTYDIIIPHYGVTERITYLAMKCLQSIRQYSQNYRLILVDNGSPLFADIELELEQHNHLLIRNCTNQGFIKAVNAGIRSSTAPYIVLMNNDTEAVPNWLEDLRRPLTGPVIASGPRTTTHSSWQGRWEKSGPPIILQQNAMLAFFCTMFKREVFDRCGVLDTDFGLGLGDDDAYCARIHRAGFRIALVPDLIIPHHHRTTFHTMFTPLEVLGMQQKALDLFHSKVKRGTV